MSEETVSWNDWSALIRSKGKDWLTWGLSLANRCVLVRARHNQAVSTRIHLSTELIEFGPSRELLTKTKYYWISCRTQNQIIITTSGRTSLTRTKSLSRWSARTVTDFAEIHTFSIVLVQTMQDWAASWASLLTDPWTVWEHKHPALKHSQLTTTMAIRGPSVILERERAPKRCWLAKPQRATLQETSMDSWHHQGWAGRKRSDHLVLRGIKVCALKDWNRKPKVI